MPGDLKEPSTEIDAENFPLKLSGKESIFSVETLIAMIHLTRLNHAPLVLNSDLIEQIEACPDTIVSLTTGQKILVLESPTQVIDRVIEFRRAISTHALSLARHDRNLVDLNAKG